MHPLGWFLRSVDLVERIADPSTKGCLVHLSCSSRALFLHKHLETTIISFSNSSGNLENALGQPRCYKGVTMVIFAYPESPILKLLRGCSSSSYSKHLPQYWLSLDGSESLYHSPCSILTIYVVSYSTHFA